MERYDDGDLSFDDDSSQTFENSLAGDDELQSALQSRADNIDEYDRPIGQGLRTPSRRIVTEYGLDFEDLTYTIVQNQKIDGKWKSTDIHLLQGISGQAVKGRLTAIMGPSGAGKSTFLDAVAGRTTQGSVSGTLRLDGRPVSCSYIRRKSAYVMQRDLLFPLLTVTETLQFAAEMHLPSVLPYSEKADRVQSLIAQLGLENCADMKIGDENHRGISAGEKRRVSIGVGIIDSPSLLFLDDPTSGLDSASVLMVMEKLFDIASIGATVLLTIREPSHRIQTMLGRIIILARGKLVYQGRPDELTPYIKDVLGREVPVNENSVDYFLDIIKEFEQSKAGLDQLVQWQRPDDGSLSFTPKTRVKFGTLFAKSAEGSVESSEGGLDLGNDYVDSEGGFDHSLTSLRSPLTPGLQLAPCVFPTKAWSNKLKWGLSPGRTRTYFTASTSSHSGTEPGFHRSPMEILGLGSPPETPYFTVKGESDEERDESGRGGRYKNEWVMEVFLLGWRNCRIMLRTPHLFVMREVIAVVVSIFLATLFGKPEENESGVKQLNSYVVFLLTLIFFSCNSSLPTYVQERNIFIRETGRKAYRASSYVVASLVLHLPFNALQTVAYLLISLWSLKLGGGYASFPVIFLVLFVSVVTANSFVMLVSALVSNHFTGYAVLITLEGFFVLMCGYFIKRSQIPVYWLWLHYMSPMTYAYEAALQTEFPNDKCFWESTQPSTQLGLFVNPSDVLRTNGTGCYQLGQNAVNQFQVNQLPIAGDITLLLLWCIIYRVALYIVLRFHSKSPWK